MKLTLIIAAASVALLAACATPRPAPLSGDAATGPIISAGTLALVGTCEMDIAADMAALVIYRQRAARALSRGQIDLDAARRVQALADIARGHLDAACPNAAATLNTAERQLARAVIRDIGAIMERKQ